MDGGYAHGVLLSQDIHTKHRLVGLMRMALSSRFVFHLQTTKAVKPGNKAEFAALINHNYSSRTIVLDITNCYESIPRFVMEVMAMLTSWST